MLQMYVGLCGNSNCQCLLVSKMSNRSYPFLQVPFKSLIRKFHKVLSRHDLPEVFVGVYFAARIANLVADSKVLTLGLPLKTNFHRSQVIFCSAIH